MHISSVIIPVVLLTKRPLFLCVQSGRRSLRYVLSRFVLCFIPHTSFSDPVCQSRREGRSEHLLVVQFHTKTIKYCKLHKIFHFNDFIVLLENRTFKLQVLLVSSSMY